jgi:hypothetical protein
MHIALAQVVAGDDAALDGRYPSGPCVPAVLRAFAAFERQDFAAAVNALEPITGELERIGGSRAQLDLVEFTLLKAYLSAARPGRYAPDAERAASRLLDHSRCRAGDSAAIDEATVT